MPTYDYVCEACGARLELFQSMKESPKKKCPECGALRLKRRIGTGAGIIFKGSGFYQTDYRSESYKKGAESEKAAQSPPKAEGKPDKPGKDAGAPDTGKQAGKGSASKPPKH